MPMTDRLRAAWPAGIAMLVALTLAGCSTTAENSGLSLVDASGNHPAGFVSTHSSIVRAPADAAQCQPCHGDVLTGGIASVSCFNAACHHDPVPNWSSPAVHGAEAKKAPGSSGFSSCQVCHGIDFAGGGSGASCLNNASCHGAGINAPHPARPWRTTGTSDTHTNADPANASVCGQCHLNGANSTKVPAPPLPPAGTPPGCFNNTLCHAAEAAPHPLGASWLNPTTADFHGTNPTINAKQNLAFCQTCHGTPGTTSFDGGIAPTACSDAGCHPVAKAHPTTWYQAPGAFPTYVPSHRNSGNRPGACVICHNTSGPGAGPMPGAPSCFSADFNNGVHGLVACHAGGPGTGGANHNVAFRENAHWLASGGSDCLTCHAETGTSPNSSAPLCTVCHTNVAVSPLTTKNCTSCHANPPGGATYPNIEGAHAEHLALDAAGTPISCDTCHNGIGFQTVSHYDRANGRVRTLTGAGLASFGAGFPYTSRSGGAATFNSALANLACTNVSCHGGQATPNWQTGAIDVNAQCTSCHELGDSTAGGTPQYNVFYSGRHKKHVADKGIACTVCHSTAALAGVHFDDLSTSAMAQARTTIKVTDLNFDGSANPPTCDPNGTGGIGGCHGGKSWTQDNLP